MKGSLRRFKVYVPNEQGGDVKNKSLLEFPRGVKRGVNQVIKNEVQGKFAKKLDDIFRVMTRISTVHGSTPFTGVLKRSKGRKRKQQGGGFLKRGIKKRVIQRHSHKCRRR